MKAASRTLHSVSVETLYLENKKRLRLRPISGKDGFKKKVREKDLHRPGLALAGFVDLFTFRRIQICGNTEMAYLKRLTSRQRDECLQKVFEFDIPCFVITNGNPVPSELRKLSDDCAIAVFSTPFATTRVVQYLGEYLDEKFSPTLVIHGSLVDVYGIGILITGRSGIGKSEVALDLVARGHRLVADDLVTISRQSGGILIGAGNTTLKHYMEIRGVGIIDVEAIFGIRAIRQQKRIEVQLELEDWDNSQNYERLGIREAQTEILGEKVPRVRLPIYPGKHISVIAEVIALNQLLKLHGRHSARQFQARITQKMQAKLKEFAEYEGPDRE